MPLRLFVTFLLSLFCSGMCAAESSALEVGVILSLTGKSAAYGQSVRNGILLAQSGLALQDACRPTLLFEDDQSQVSQSVLTFKKLTDLDRVDAVVSMSAQPSLAIAPLAEQKQIPHLAIAVPPEIVEGRRYVFLFFALRERLASTLVNEMLRRKYGHIARITTTHEGRLAMKEAVDAYNADRVQVVIDEDFSPEVLDFRSFILRVKSDPSVDGIYVNLFLGQLGAFAKQSAEMGLHKTLFTSEFFTDLHEREVAGAALDQDWYVDQAEPGPEFVKAYRKRFGDEPGVGSANGHDLLLLLHAACLAGGAPPSRETLRDFVAQASGLRGALGRIESNKDQRFDLHVQVKELRWQADIGRYAVKVLSE